MKNSIYIKSLSYYIPRGRLTNEDILTRIKNANKDHIKKEELEHILYGNSRKFDFLGIKTRSYCLKDDKDNVVTMAQKVSLSAIEKANIKVDQIDCIIVSGVTNPFREPSFALLLANLLGLTHGDFFDINDTCNGFLKSIDIASQYIKAGKYKNILLVTSENPYELAEGLGINYRVENESEVDNKFSTLIVGCGAAALILSGNSDGRKVISYYEKRETQNWNASILTIPGIYLPDSEYRQKNCGIWTNARLISAQIINNIPGFIKETILKWNMSIDDFNLLIMHQLGNNITFATLDKLNVNQEISPVNTFSEFGNMACANIPINLAIACEQGKVTEGDSILLVSSACGLSYALLHIRW